MRAYEIAAVRATVAILEGGNIRVGDIEAQQIDLTKHQRSQIVGRLDQMLNSINVAYKKMFGQLLWDQPLMQTGQHLSGSSKHFFDVKKIKDADFVGKKSRVGDIDTMVSKVKEGDLKKFLDQTTGKRVGNATLVGYKSGNEQFSSLDRKSVV